MAPAKPRAVAFLIFDGAQSLDVTGPLEAFAQGTLVADFPGVRPCGSRARSRQGSDERSRPLGHRSRRLRQ